jgi:hypothetical protein
LLFIFLCYTKGFSQTYVSTRVNDTTGTGSSTLTYKTIAKGISAVASGWTSTDIYFLGVVNTSSVTIDGLTIKNEIRNGSKGILILANSGATAILNNIAVKNCIVTNI